MLAVHNTKDWQKFGSSLEGRRDHSASDLGGMRDNFVLNKCVVICRIPEIIIFIFLMPKLLQFCFNICHYHMINNGKLKVV